MTVRSAIVTFVKSGKPFTNRQVLAYAHARGYYVTIHAIRRVTRQLTDKRRIRAEVGKGRTETYTAGRYAAKLLPTKAAA